jgi:hypothetical protein
MAKTVEGELIDNHNRIESAILAHFVSMRNFNVGWEEVESVPDAWTGTKIHWQRVKITHLHGKMALQDSAGGLCVRNAIM